MCTPCSPAFPPPPPLLLPNASSPAPRSRPSRGAGSRDKSSCRSAQRRADCLLGGRGSQGKSHRVLPAPCRGRGDATLRQRFIYLILLGWDFFFFSFLKRPPGNCSPWNINATLDAGSLKCHLAVISPTLIIPQGPQAPIPPRPWRSWHAGQPCPSPLPQHERCSITLPKMFLALFHHRSNGLHHLRHLLLS